jgi:hypothetical protein
MRARLKAAAVFADTKDAWIGAGAARPTRPAVLLHCLLAAEPAGTLLLLINTIRRSFTRMATCSKYSACVLAELLTVQHLYALHPASEARTVLK